MEAVIKLIGSPSPHKSLECVHLCDDIENGVGGLSASHRVPNPRKKETTCLPIVAAAAAAVDNDETDDMGVPGFL
jgi:hypothetical protein